MLLWGPPCQCPRPPLRACLSSMRLCVLLPFPRRGAWVRRAGVPLPFLLRWALRLLARASGAPLTLLRRSTLG